MGDTRFVDIGAPLDIRSTRQYMGKGVTGLIVSLTIKRESDGLYWTGTTWSTLTVLTMTKISDDDCPGEHRYIGNTPSVADIFTCHAFITTGKYAFDDYETLVARQVVTGLTQQEVRDAMAGFDPTVGITSGSLDNMILTRASEISATENKNSIILSIYGIPEEVDNVLTSAHGGGMWDAVSNTPVVLSASQPYYAPAIAGDPMTLIPALSASILKHEDLIDGKTVDYILEASMAMVNGNFSISGDILTLYKRDGITPFSVINKTTTTRQRVS